MLALACVSSAVPRGQLVFLVFCSDGFFDIKEQPKKVAVVGAGYIAVELAGIFHALGTEAHLFIRKERAMRTLDPLLSEILDLEVGTAAAAAAAAAAAVVVVGVVVVVVGIVVFWYFGAMMTKLVVDQLHTYLLLGWAFMRTLPAFKAVVLLHMGQPAGVVDASLKHARAHSRKPLVVFVLATADGACRPVRAQELRDGEGHQGRRHRQAYPAQQERRGARRL